MVSKTVDEPLTTHDLMDGMRAVAAIAVLFSHQRNILFNDAAADLSWPWKCFYFITGFGHQAVMIFFVLSGYWIAKSVARQHEGKQFDWTAYAIDRLSRLWIVLFPALILGGALDGVGRYVLRAPLYLGVQGASVLTEDVAAHLSPVTFLGNLGFLQTLLVAPFGSNGSLWSLANEFWYYVWFPPLYLLMRGRISSLPMLAAALVSMTAFRTLLPGFLCWLFGAMLFFAAKRPLNAPASRASRFGAALTGLAFLAILVSTKLPGLWLDEAIADIFISGSFALLLYSLMRASATFSPRLALVCRFGARSSYSLYAVHLPLVAMLAATFWTPARRLPPSATPLLAFVCVTLVALGGGYLFSLCTEAHTSTLRLWLKRQYMRRRQLAA
jgi:peptidoglycan/LPS O-acetylase OafA/YrhL